MKENYKKPYLKPETEIWRVYYENSFSKTSKRYIKYEVSNLGRVKRNGNLYVPKINNGYYQIGIGIFVHRAVAKLFIPNPYNKPEVDHIDGDKTNNRYDNLRWVTHKENCNNPITIKQTKQGERNPMYGRVGENHPMYRKKHSKESKEKISKKMSEIQRGKKRGKYKKKKAANAA